MERHYIQTLQATRRPPSSSQRWLLAVALACCLMVGVLMYLLMDEHNFRVDCKVADKGTDVGCHYRYLKHREGTWQGLAWLLMAHGGSMPTNGRELWP